MQTTLAPKQVRGLPNAWKTAISIVGAIAMSPIIAGIAGLLVVWVLPALLFVLPIIAVSWARTLRLPARPVGPALPLRTAAGT